MLERCLRGRKGRASTRLPLSAGGVLFGNQEHFEADRQERQEPATRFFDALREGDVGGLRELLAADVSMVGDGGGKAPQLSRALIGAENLARLLAPSSAAGPGST